MAREGKRIITNNFFSFWFNFIKRYENYYEQGKTISILDFFKEGINSYMGKMFENFCFLFVKENRFLAFPLTKITKHWGCIPGIEKGKNQYDVDIIGLDSKFKRILFCECKWKDNVNAKKILEELRRKSDYVIWQNRRREEYFCIFAKSFKEKIKEKNLFLFDLKDLEMELR